MRCPHTRCVMPEPRAPKRITVREIVDPRDPALTATYALLRTNFSRGERVDRREWTASLREREAGMLSDLAWHLIIAERDGEVLGLVSGTYVGSVNVGVVGYLAIAEAGRGEGLGTRLRNHLRRRFARDAERIAHRPLTGIIGEVSPGNPWLRRLARSPRVLMLDFPYYQPRLRDDDDPSPFVLYIEAFGNARRRIPVAELKQILFAIWRRIYRIPRPLDRPAFRAMMRALEGRRTVGPLRLAAPESR